MRISWGPDQIRKRILALFHLTSKGLVRIKPPALPPLARGDFISSRTRLKMKQECGGVPEWLKGTDCKSVGFAYVGSNPTPSTILPHLSDISSAVSLTPPMYVTPPNRGTRSLSANRPFLKT